MLDSALRETEFRGVTIVIPIVNESDSAKRTVEIILADCDKRDITEILFIVSQNAEQACLDNIKNVQAAYSDVEINCYIQSHPGIGGAGQDAFEKAKGSHIVTIPADLELDPHCVCKMIEQSKINPDKVITTSRWLIKDNFKDYNRIKKVFNFCGQIFLAFLYQRKLTDMSSPTQLCPSVIYKNINWERYDFPFVLELSLKPIRLGAQYVEVPVKLTSRKEGKSSNSIKMTAMYLPVAIHIRFMSKNKIMRK